MARDHSYGKVVERHSWTRWVWLVWATLATGTLAISVVVLTTMITAVEHRSYSGVLQSKVQEVDFLLAEGLPLKEVLVQNGETVTAGQTIAVLDVDRLRILVSDLQQNILTDNILRKCLQSGETPTQATLQDSTLDTDTQLKLVRVTKECQAITERHEVQIRRILLAKSHLNEEHTQRMRRMRRAAHGVEDTVIQTRIAVQIAIELGNNSLRDGQIDLEIMALRADQKKEMVAILRALEQAVSKARLRKAALERALSSPRLYASLNGTVSDRRVVQPGREYLQQILLLKISGTGTFEYNPSFAIPRSDAAMLNVGHPVSISVIGNQMDTFELKGTILSIQDTVDVGNGQPLVRLVARLDEASLSIVSSSTVSKQLAGRNSRSEISFTLRELDLTDFLLRSAKGLFKPKVNT